MQALMIVGQVVGLAMSFAGQRQSARQEERVADYNQEVAGADVAAEQRALADEEERLKREKVARLSSQQQAAALSGVVPEEGSPLLAMEETIFNVERDLQTMRRESGVRQAQIQNQANIGSYQASTRAAAKRTEAGSSLLQGSLTLGKSLGKFG